MEGSMPQLRVAVGGIAQETNTFTGIPTTMAEFEGRGGELSVDSAVIDEHRGVNSVIGGFIDELEAAGDEILPTLHARATPGGPLTRDTYERLRDDLLARLAGLPAVDAVLLALHGAMAADGYPDPEGDLLTRVRAVVGTRPVFAVLDLHANVSRAMVEAADLLVGYKTYPHVDMAARGRQAAGALRRLVAGEVAIERAFVPLPMLLPSIRMRTIDEHGPYAILQRYAADLEAADHDVLELGLYGGFPYADVPFHHACVLVYHARSADRAAFLGEDLAQRYWDSRQAFLAVLEPAEAAVDRALAATTYPVVLADVADNPGSGGAGDTPGLLRLLVERDAPGSFVGILFDPASAERAFALGEGREAAFELGGKVNPEHGPPVPVRARVERLSDGVFTVTGPMMHGKRERLGRTALLRVGNVHVAVSEGRASVNDPAMLTMLGLDVSDLNILALKVKGHFRAAFDPLVAQVIEAEAPGASMTDFTRLAYRHRLRPAFPFEPDAAYPPAADPDSVASATDGGTHP
jgi:microcystin degradation protein MlrC